jgi:hypothetical protein
LALLRLGGRGRSPRRWGGGRDEMLRGGPSAGVVEMRQTGKDAVGNVNILRLYARVVELADSLVLVSNTGVVYNPPPSRTKKEEPHTIMF